MKGGSSAGPLPPVALFDNYWAPTLAFASSLGPRNVPIHVYGAGASRWSRFCRRRASCPPVEDADHFLPWLQARIRAGEISRVAPTTDLIAYYTAYLRDEFPPEVRRSIAPLQEVETALIKSRFAEACAAIGQAVPDMRCPHDLPSALTAGRELGYPLILKPKSHLVVGAAERGHLIHNESALRTHFRRYTPAPGQSILESRYPELCWPLLQRYIPSARQCVYSVSGVKDADRGVITASLSVKNEQYPPDVGTSTMQISHLEPNMLAAGLRTADQLVSRGIFELELLVENGQYLAIDLNPRAFGFINLDIALGHDLPWLWFRSTMEPVSPQNELPLPDHLEARHVILHLLNRLSKGRTRKLGSRAVKRRDPKPQRPWISILGRPTDPVPMLLCHALILRHPRSLIRTFISVLRAGRAHNQGKLLGAREPE